jgi:hypothetical protein
MEDPIVSDEYAWKPGPNDLNPTKELSDTWRRLQASMWIERKPGPNDLNPTKE